MAIQPLTPLPVPPLATDSEAVFNAKADATLLAEKQFVDQMNASTIPGINQAVTDATAAKNAAAGSATAAAQSATDANTATAAAQKAVTDSAAAGAAQVVLAAAEVAKAQQQVALAQQQVQAASDAGAAQVTLAAVEVTKAQAEVEKAKAQADASAASALAAGAAAGLPPERVPYAALQIDPAGNVAWRPGLPDHTNAYGKTLMASRNGWVASDPKAIGEVLYSAADVPLSPLQSVGSYAPGNPGYGNVAYGNGRFVSVSQNGAYVQRSEDGISWTQTALSLTGVFIRLAFGAGLFVLTGSSMDRVYTSADGLTWTARELASGITSPSFTKIIHTGNYFVLCGDSDITYYFTSIDGISWTKRNLQAVMSVRALTSLGNNGFLMFYSGGCYKYSSYTSTPVLITGIGTVSGAACNTLNGTVVAVLDTASTEFYGKCQVSKDFGSTWAAISMPFVSRWVSVFFLNGMFVASASNPNAKLAASTDGVSWSPVTLNTAVTAYDGAISDMASTNGVIVTSGYKGFYALKKGPSEYVKGSSVYLKAGYPELAAMLGSLPSDYGVTARTMGASAIFTDMAYGNGVFVALTTGVTYCTSANGVTWTSRSMPVNTTWRGVTFANGVFVAVCYNGVFTSPDGVTWTSRNTDTGNWSSVAYGNGVWLVTSATGSTTGGTNAKTLTSSDNGGTWTVRTPPAFTTGATKLAFGAGVFVLVVYNATASRVFYSPDGIAWYQSQVPATGSVNLTSVVYGNGMFVALSGSSDYYLTSVDGANWIERQLPANYATGVNLGGFAAGMFLGFYPNGFVLVSTDGINWTTKPLKQSATWGAIAFGAGVLAVAAGGSSSSTIGMTLFNWNYDLITQFATPALDAPQGLTGYIKARAA